MAGFCWPDTDVLAFCGTGTLAGEALVFGLNKLLKGWKE